MKKLISIMLSAALVFGMSSVAFAAGGKITDVVKPVNTNYSPSTYEVAPGTVWEFPLTANMFNWSEGTGAANEPVTSAQLRAGGVTVKYTSSESSIIDSVTLASKSFSASGNNNTAYIKFKFIEDYNSVESKDFRINLFLAVNNTRKEASRITLEGTFENRTETVSTGTDYVDISDGRVIKPSGYINGLELYLGSGVTIKTRVYSNQKYWGVAENIIKVEDDKVVSAHPSIDHIINLKTINLKGSGNIVSLDYDNYYVYDSNGKYLGTSGSMLPYSTKYYLSSKQIDMSGTNTGSSSSSSTSSSSSSTTSTSSTTGSTTTTATGEISTATAKAQMESAVSTAKSSGSATASVRFKDSGSISGEALRTMASTASSSNLKAKMIADTMSGNSVVGRLTINPALATNITGSVKLGVHVDSSHVKSTQDKFSKWFKNDVAVVALDQSGSYGMSVVVAAKVSLGSMSTTNLKFYSYDKSANKYTEITSPNYSIDSAGYLHFTTTMGGDIVVSNGTLSRS